MNVCSHAGGAKSCKEGSRYLDCDEIVNDARRKLDIRRASAMLCRVTTPAGPNGSSRGRPYASDWSWMETN